MNAKSLTLLSVLVSSLFASSARADALLFDQSPLSHPDSIANGEWMNYADNQTFAEKFTLSQGAFITEIGWYSGVWYGAKGMDVTLRIFADADGKPGEKLLDFTGTLGAIDYDGSLGVKDTARDYNVDIVQKHVALSSPFHVDGSTLYWLEVGGGREGAGQEIAMTSFLNMDDGIVAQFSGDRFLAMNPYLGDASFRVYGTPDEVVKTPDAMSSASMLALGLALLGVVRRRK